MPLFCLSDLIFQFNISLQAGQSFCPVGSLFSTRRITLSILKSLHTEALGSFVLGKPVDEARCTDGFLWFGAKLQAFKCEGDLFHILDKLSFQIKLVKRVSSFHSCSNKQWSSVLTGGPG